MKIRGFHSYWVDKNGIAGWLKIIDIFQDTGKKVIFFNYRKDGESRSQERQQGFPGQEILT